MATRSKTPARSGKSKAETSSSRSTVGGPARRAGEPGDLLETAEKGDEIPVEEFLRILGLHRHYGREMDPPPV